MKTSLLLSGVTVAIFGLAVGSTTGQTQSTAYIQTSKLVGTKVKSAQGEEIGAIKDVVIDRGTGCLAYTVLSTGGGTDRATAGGKLVAVPWAVYSPTSDVSVLSVTVDRERIYNAPVFNYERIDEYSRPDYITNVYSYYGVSQGAEIGAGVSGTSTTTGVSGGATGRAGAVGSPAQAASPAASTPPATTRSPAERESPAGRGSPRPGTTAARPHATASPHVRGGAEASPRAGEEEERSRKARPEETESPSSRAREEQGTRAKPEETEPPNGGAELQREPSSRATRESPSEAQNPSEKTTEGTQTRPHRKPERRETNTPPPED
jgi:sporulation protein YlmC with PRC-barrel domain